MKSSPAAAPPPADRLHTLATDDLVAELGERLFVHFVAGRWRTPLGTRLLAAGPVPAGRHGHLVCGDDRDAARALAGLGAGNPAGLAEAYEELRPALMRLRRLEGHEDPAGPAGAASLPGQGPLVLLTPAALPVARLASLLIAAVPRGVVWKPAPGAAASAHLMVAALGPLAAGALALVQGDHATGAALARLAPAVTVPATG